MYEVHPLLHNIQLNLKKIGSNSNETDYEIYPQLHGIQLNLKNRQ